jgi:hypothetical protein
MSNNRNKPAEENKNKSCSDTPISYESPKKEEPKTTESNTDKKD